MPKPRILIADDHVLIAEACRKLLEPEYEVIGIVNDGRTLVQVALEVKPNVVLIDIAMPLLNGLDAGHKIKEALPAIKVVYLTMNPDVELAAEAFRHKASGYLLKTCAASDLLVALRVVLRGETYLSPALSRDTVGFLARQEKDLVQEGERLTDRQREVLQLLAEGKSMKEVGAILNVAARTVAFHKYRMMELLRLHTNAELVQYALKHHIITP